MGNNWIKLNLKLEYGSNLVYSKLNYNEGNILKQFKTKVYTKKNP